MEQAKVNVNVRLVEDNRISIANFGQLYGKRIFKAAKIACNLDFNRDLRMAQDNNGLCSNRSPYRFKVIPVDIVGLNLEKDLDGTNVIVINKGLVDNAGESIEIRCPLDHQKFTRDVTPENLTDALNKKDFANIYFANAKKLAETLNPSNQNEIARIEKLISELEKQKELISKTYDYNIQSVNSYYQQLDEKRGAVKVSVTVEDEN